MDITFVFLRLAKRLIAAAHCTHRFLLAFFVFSAIAYALNFSDDEFNPVELPVLEALIPKVRDSRFFAQPGSAVVWALDHGASRALVRTRCRVYEVARR
jgi:hypothetical protein